MIERKYKCASCIYGESCLKTWTHNFDTIDRMTEFFRFCNYLCSKFKLKEDKPKEVPDWDNITETGEGPWIN